MGVDLSDIGRDGRKQHRQNSSEEGHRHSSPSLFEAQGTLLFTLFAPFFIACVMIGIDRQECVLGLWNWIQDELPIGFLILLQANVGVA